MPGATLPPHFSPFTKESSGDYIPVERLEELRNLGADVSGLMPGIMLFCWNYFYHSWKSIFNWNYLSSYFHIMCPKLHRKWYLDIYKFHFSRELEKWGQMKCYYIYEFFIKIISSLWIIQIQISGYFFLTKMLIFLIYRKIKDAHYFEASNFQKTTARKRRKSRSLRRRKRRWKARRRACEWRSARCTSRTPRLM